MIIHMKYDFVKLRKQLESGEIKPLSKLQGGMMNRSQIIELDGIKYVWYTPTEQANEMVDRKLEKSNIDKVYPLGITSKNLVFYEDGMKINEFIEGKSLNLIDDFDTKEVAKILHKLHDSNVLSDKDYLPFEKVANYIKEVESLDIKLDEDFYILYKDIYSKKDFLESQKLTICHNDFQRSNIIKTPDNKYYMIDFEFMMNNDPVFDIAAFGNNNVVEGYQLLKDYFSVLDKDIKTRFFYWRMLLSLQWYLVALIKDKRGEGKEHGFDFYQVAQFFLGNAKSAREMFQKEIN